jgi:hypothetical protein
LLRILDFDAINQKKIFQEKLNCCISSYATMPRKPLNGVSTVVNGGNGIGSGATYRRDQQFYADERRRQAYIQSLGMKRTSYLIQKNNILSSVVENPDLG